MFFFFFQAEDGIRDHCVTGVQTCALPISSLYANYSEGFKPAIAQSVDAAGVGRPPEKANQKEVGAKLDFLHNSRSEERRVGKECRSRWSPYTSKKKKRRRIEKE